MKRDKRLFILGKKGVEDIWENLDVLDCFLCKCLLVKLLMLLCLLFELVFFFRKDGKRLFIRFLNNVLNEKLFCESGN